MKQIMDAIAVCHKAGIIHGNIKPENILMACDNNCAPIKLCGFGRTIIQNKFKHISALHYYEQNDLFDSLPQTYLAPELRQENSLFTKASDIYSCGILLLTLLCGSALNFDEEIDFFSVCILFT
jgi:serine/threonine protein kinase